MRAYFTRSNEEHGVCRRIGSQTKKGSDLKLLIKLTGACLWPGVNMADFVCSRVSVLVLLASPHFFHLSVVS